ncbi:uncharacterized protein EI90DRAFT_3156603 [Cantharellus anzutake]|uniref:uncharacterized protein n=1 Tax=Cantharellus anzutake TaxID=1750568 RepID=UPI0019066317|nr:uncharacterized protein EI90DRAFT_3156603 [Cantharellus anzutake]KAF8326320.1 hypothetical protein EI90DRAFT_3156603 [Cantharellus anzutake]
MRDLLCFVINHVFMPPKLPQETDDSSKHTDFLLLTVRKSIELHRRQFAIAEHQVMWGSLLGMVDILRRINECQEVGISECIERMSPGETIAILIRAQNAGVIIRCGGKETTFESFEVSPRNQDVMGCTRKLLRSFPGPAITVRNDIACDPAFLKELAAFLTQMDAESLEDAQIMTRKARSNVIEERDTTHPRYITELLTGILCGLGQPADVSRIRKRTSDDVLWDKTSLPWRRSPLWLVVRVALQTTIHRETLSTNEYKRFMVLLLADILHLSVKNRLPGDILHCMRAKLSRRLFKIRSWVDSALVTYVHEVVLDTEWLLQDRWKAVQDAQMRTPIWAPDELDVIGDTELTLKNSMAHIIAALVPAVTTGTTRNTAFIPDHHRRLPGFLFEFIPQDLPPAVKANGSIALWDFERSVQDHIDLWVRSQMYSISENACDTLSNCMTTYAENAARLYAGVPEQQSIMLLTLFELWRALDMLAVASCPLLKDYSPEVPPTLYEALLLRKSKSLERISMFQAYLHKRYREASGDPRSIFSESIDEDIFAVKFFDSSPSLQEVRCRIEAQATAKRDEKLRELSLLNLEYEEKMELADSLDHSDFITRRGYVVHDRYCQKCKYERQARALKIDIHEWPLPEDEIRAKMVVFELAGPRVFKTWRTTTYWLLRDICTPPLSSVEAHPSMTLEHYANLNHLSGYLVSDSRRRISLASQEKSFLTSHYNRVKIPASEEDVCLRNALSYRVYDEHHNTWVHPPSWDCGLRHKTSIPISQRSPYASLEHFAQRTSHTSNEVLASQHRCPPSLNLHEFIAFGSLRAGARLQWYNIVREIASGNLSLHREEVYDLISQAACQIGCLSNGGLWEFHEELRNPSFGDVLLGVLDQLGTDIEGNWLHSVTALSITTLASRLLASASTGTSIISKTYSTLRKIRKTTLGWLRDLMTLESEAQDDLERNKYQAAICRIAATCRSTFDVDSCHVPSLLQSSKDVATFIECAIIVNIHSPQVTSANADPHLHRLLLQDQCLSCNMEGFLIARIQAWEPMKGINSAVANIWNGFDLTCRWTRLPEPNDRWLTTTTTIAGQRRQEVHLNILSGSLLIDGKPLGRLPPEIVGHSTYIELFGAKNLAVVPSNMEDMDYATKVSLSRGSATGTQEEEDGHQIIHFAWRDGKLVLRSRSRMLDGKDGRVWELLPREIFRNDLPSTLIDDHFHWLEPSTRQVELRSKEAPWTSSRVNWHLRLTRHSTWVLVRQPSITLIDCQSHTAEMICVILRSLEAPNNVLITSSPTHELLVDLPRFQLSFALKGGRLCSLNFPGFEVDENQSTGTMLGLQSQLVLRQSEDLANSVELSYSRRVIIPMGDISITRDDDHVAVTIKHSGSRRVEYYDYDVDTLLGRLVGNGSLSSALFQSYLHAITSYCLPDPLTSLSGTEEALRILRSARCKSFQSLNGQERGLLHQLSTLTPSRDWYPSHLRVMQQAIWDGKLNPIVQHDAFWSEVQSILEWGNQMHVFHQDVPIGNSKDRRHMRELHLLSRAGYRNAAWHGPGISSDVSGEDSVYESRDDVGGLDFARVRDASNVSSLVYRGPFHLKTTKNLLSQIQSWREEIRGYSTNDVSGVRLGYNKEWLSFNMPDTWVPLYNACRSAGWEIVRFKLVFSLSAIEYSRHPCKDLIPAFLAFARYPEFRVIDPPPWQRYKFSEGWTPDPGLLHAAVAKCVLPFQETTNPLVRDVVRIERRKKYDAQVSSQVWSFVADLVTSPPLGEVRTSFVSYRDVFLRESPILAPTPSPPRAMKLSAAKPFSVHDSLRILISNLRSAESPLFREYGNDLEVSREALQHDAETSAEWVEILREVLDHSHQTYRTYLSHILEQIERVINPDPQFEAPEEVMHVAGLWPKTSIRSLLHHLSFSSRSKVSLSPDWENTLVCLAQSILLLQQSERLMRSRHNTDDFLRECQNYTDLHDTSDRLDWLLVQIDSNFLIRSLQVDVARNMMSPCPQDNTILQLNMGEGKSSVIVPLIAASLADGQKLVRIIVLKPLANQMFQLLVRRLSGLANRRVYYMPFSRTISVDENHLSLFQRIYHECMQAGGILVMQPEHVLSFKLMGIYRQLSAVMDEKTPNAMLKLQQWLDSNVRDILDESDEILAVKYQLVYTVGAQQPLDHHPDRWTVVQHVFSILRSHTQFIEEFLPQGGFELEQQRGGCFPRLRILKSEAGVQLMSSLVHGIMSGNSPDLPSFRLFHGRVRQEAVAFITERNPGELDELRNHCRGDSRLWNTLLLLRGLFAQGILIYVLGERRWRVDYGLDLTRSLLAVPYRAKDVPALRAEFSHPDVCISLTCLSYYYGGLSCDQLDTCFELLSQLEDPVVEYSKWIKENCFVPKSLSDYSSFNPNDHRQRINHLYPAFTRNQETINFFLSRVVFPREAKAFPQKLSTSGWDIAERRQHVTTGFSGTNDNRYLLPTSIRQADIPAQLSTNAKVLNLMLQPENNYRTAASSKFLDLVIKETPQIRVLLDVGAQMLEYSNKGLASIWLSQIPEGDVDAAIFFSEDDEIHVIKRDGETEPFTSSSYRRRLDRCLVYLDDSHTRGTDLKLPIDYRAAVTLGRKVTKDRLVQGELLIEIQLHQPRQRRMYSGCMRMRRLGQGQSVIFLAPPDVDRAIRKVSAKEDGERITAYDVLSWSISETCASLQRHSCHWREQGIHYIDRRCAWEEFWSSGASEASKLERYWLQPESKSLEEMYEASPSSEQLEREPPHHPGADCREIEQRSRVFLSPTDNEVVRMEEEQEREVTHELERERQIERPPALLPASHILHPDVVSFVRSGQISPDTSPAFIPLFSSVSILPRSFQQGAKWSNDLFATRDFTSTIQGTNVQENIEFLRPVNWIPSSTRNSTLVVCSPFEVNKLIPEIRRSHNTTLRVYSPRTSQPMKSFDDLEFYTIPSLPTMRMHPERLTISQLGVFSGQLYLKDFETYLELCNFLGVNTSHDGSNEVETQSDGFILPKNRTEMRLVCPFDNSPLPFIHRLTSLRRKGIPYTSTHLGRIVHGAFVRPEDF